MNGQRCGTCRFYRGSRKGDRSGGWEVMQGCGTCTFAPAPSAFRRDRTVTETQGTDCEVWKPVAKGGAA